MIAARCWHVRRTWLVGIQATQAEKLRQLTVALQAIGSLSPSRPVPTASPPGRCTTGGSTSPAITADGKNVAVTACSGDIQFATGKCTVDPCDLANDLKEAERKLDLLANL